MPVYTYDCPKCGEFDFYQPTYEPLRKCPDCSNKVRKLLSACTFILKGEGWTKTEMFNYKVAQKEKELEVEEVAEERELRRKRKEKVKQLMPDSLIRKVLKRPLLSS